MDTTTTTKTQYKNLSYYYMSPSLILFAIFCVILFIIITDKSSNRYDKVEGYDSISTGYAYVPTFEPTWIKDNYIVDAFHPYRFNYDYGYRYPVLYNPLYMSYPYSHRYLHPRRSRRVIHRIVTK